MNEHPSGSRTPGPRISRLNHSYVLEVSQVSHQATRYAKHLVMAPNGEKITASEKLVLTQLADDHHMEIGAAWPSIRSLAIRCCLSPRHTRRILTSLVRKQVIRRMAYKRDRDNSQSSNEYIFLALAHFPSFRDQSALRNRVQKVSRSPMTVPQSRSRPADTAIAASRSRPTGSALRGHLRPAIEYLSEVLENSSTKRVSEQIPPSPLNAVAMSKEIQHLPSSNEQVLWFKDLRLARLAWKQALSSAEATTMSQKTPFPIREGSAVESIDAGKAGDLMITLKVQEPNLTKEDFEQLQRLTVPHLQNWFGVKVKLKLSNRKKL